MRFIILALVSVAFYSCGDNPVSAASGGGSSGGDMVLMYAQNQGGARTIAMYTDSAFIDSCPRYTKMQIYVKNGIGLNNSGVKKTATFHAAPGAVWLF